MAKTNRKRTSAKQKRARIANLEKARKARAEKAIRLAEERMESPPQPKSLAPGGSVEIPETSHRKLFAGLVEEFDEAVRMHDSRGAGDPAEFEEKERYYEFTKARLLAYAELF